MYLSINNSRTRVFVLIILENIGLMAKVKGDYV